MIKKEKRSKAKSPDNATKRRNAEESLHQSEERYQTILENIEEGYFEVDLAGNFTFFNDTLCRVIGYPREELMGMNNRHYTDEKELKRVFQAYNKVYKTGEPQKRFCWQIIRKDGTKRYIEGTIFLLKNSSGTPIGFRGISRDITERKQIEEKLHLEEQLFRTLTEQSSDMIVLVNREFKVAYANPALETFLGLKHEEIIGSDIYNFVHPDEIKLVADIFNIFFNDKNSNIQRTVLRFRHKDGAWRKFEIVGSNLVRNKVVESVIINLRDITERMLAAELLKQSEEKYRLLAEHMKDTVWITDLGLKVIYVSPSAEKLLGYTQDEIIQLPLDKILTSASFNVAMDFFSIELPKALAAPPDYILTRSLELEFRCKNGHTVWGECMFSLIRDNNGEPLSILGEARVITERKQIEYELRASESNFRHSLDDSPLGVRISTIEGETIYANKAILDIYGYNSIEELKNTRLKQRYTPESYAEWEVRKKKRLEGESGPSEYEISIVRKTGEIRHLHVFRKGIFWDGKKQSQVIYQDITLRKQAEEKIHQSEEKYRTILENMDEAYFEVDLAGNFTFFNNSFCRILGYTPEEMMGLNYKKYTDQENAKRNYQVYNKVYKTGEPAEAFDWQMIRKDGVKIDVEESMSLIKDSSGKPTGFRGMVRDVTGRKQAEEKLRQSEVKYRLLADNITEHVWLRDISSLKIIYLSPSVEKMYGYPLDEISKLPLKKLLTEESFQKIIDTFITEMPKALATLPPIVHKYSLETQARHKDGHLLWMENTISFIRDENGNLSLLLGETRDITERKLAEEKLQETLNSLRKAFSTTIQVMVSAIEMRDPYTAGHQNRVADIARAIAKEMGLSQEKIDGIRMAGIIHDIGKLSIPVEILSKPTKLTEIEFSLIKQHSQSGYEMLKNVESPWPLAEIVHQHHERLNGTGYPRKLKGNEILIEARIIAVADVVEAIASHRPYRASLGIETALAEIENNKGILYDEVVACTCLKLFREKGYQFT